MFLAIDTSTQYAGVALINDEGRLAQLMHWRSQHNHTVELIPSLEMVMKREGISFASITGIAVAAGPGSFSALRVGLSLAKGLAWSRGIPLATVTTFEAEAFPYQVAGVPVCSVLDAGRGQLMWALFPNRGDEFCQPDGQGIATPEELLGALPSPVLLCGEALERYGDALTLSKSRGMRLALPYLASQRVSAVAFLGYARLKAGLVQDPASVQPLYLRRPTITEPKQRPSGAAAGNTIAAPGVVTDR